MNRCGKRGPLRLVGCFSSQRFSGCSPPPRHNARLTTLNPKARVEGVYLGSLLILNLGLWYIPAALTGPIFQLATRFRLDADRWLRSVAIHAAAAMAFSIIHTSVMMVIRVLLWPEMRSMPQKAWISYVQDQYLRNLDWSLMTYAAVMGLSYALGYYRESQARALKAEHLETSLMEARLKTLEAELHPHFLFNTLHAISTLVHTNPEAADRMISRLSDLLRLTFDRSGAAGVPLKEELEFLQKYLEIEQIRFQDRLTVKFDIDPETLDTQVPRMILQPLVENAIKHGIGPRSGQARPSVGEEAGQRHLDRGAGQRRRSQQECSRAIHEWCRPVEYADPAPVRNQAMNIASISPKARAACRCRC